MNLDGSWRTTPLKKPRAFLSLEFFIPPQEYERIKKMKNPMEMLCRLEEHMTIYRNDGSSVTISSENGQVKVTDSRNKSTYSIMKADHFLSRIL